MSEQETIEAGKRIAGFLADDAVKAALIDLEKRYFAEFKRSSESSEREALHARVLALDDLFSTLLGTVNSGKIAQHTREQREKLEARQRTPRGR